MQSLIRQVAHVKLEDVANMQYFGDIFFGMQSRPSRMLFDTGSPDVWLYSREGCEASGKCPKDKR